MEIWLIWIIAALVLLVVELATTAVAALCLMIGCIVAAVPAFFDAMVADCGFRPCFTIVVRVYPSYYYEPLDER